MNKDELDEKIRKALRNSSITLVAAAVVSLVSLMIDFKDTTGSPGFWFQRSGAIAVLLAAGVEYWLLQIHTEINPSASAYVAEMKWQEKYGSTYRFLSRAALFILISGTFIWGYGDLPFKSF